MISLINLLKEESFTAINKDSGKTTVFKSKSNRDAAIKAGTHDKKDGKDSKGGDVSDNPKADKPNMFSKDTGYDAGGKSKEEPKNEPLNVTDDFIDSLKSKYKNVSNQTPKQEKELETTLDKLDKEQLKKLAFSDINVVSDIASKKWYKLSYPSDDEPKKDKSEPSTSDSLYAADDFQDTVDDLEGKISDEDYQEIKDNLKALANLQYDLEDIDRDEDNEEWGMQKDTIDVEVDDLKGLIKQAISKSSEPKSEPTKDSTQQRAGNEQVNKVVRNKAKSLGVTPQKLGKEEYEKRMSQAAVEALTDANFHSESRALIAVLEDNPELAKNPSDDPNKPEDMMSDEYDEWKKGTAWGSSFGDSSDGTDDIAHSATGESSWDGQESIDAIAFDLKMNGSKELAAKIQSIFNEKNESSTKLTSMINRG